MLSLVYVNISRPIVIESALTFVIALVLSQNVGHELVFLPQWPNASV